MTQLTIILITSALTLIGGVLLLVLGEVIKGFFIEPIHELSRLRGKTTNTLILYADVIANPGIDTPERLQEAHAVLRRRAAQLLVRSEAVPWYGLWRRLGFVPKREDVESASMLLIGLSNSVFRPDGGPMNDKNRIEILRLIGHRKIKKHTTKLPPPDKSAERRGLT